MGKKKKKHAVLTTPTESRDGPVYADGDDAGPSTSQPPALPEYSLDDAVPAPSSPDIGTRVRRKPVTVPSHRGLPHVGWGVRPGQRMSDALYTDNVARIASGLGSDGYNFVAIPLGGFDRANFTFPDDSTVKYAIPDLYLPGAQLDTALWRNYVHGILSPWIDADNGREDIRKASCQAVFEEFDQASFLGIKTVYIVLRRKVAVRLYKIIGDYLTRRAFSFKIVIMMSANSTAYEDASQAPLNDLYGLWVFTRRFVEMYDPARLRVGLYFTSGPLCADLLDSSMIKRWNAEALNTFWLTEHCFTNGKVLLDEICFVVNALFTSPDQQEIVIGPGTHFVQDDRVAVIHHLAEILQPKKLRALSLQGVVFDVIGCPMETLVHNLSTLEYRTMEQDVAKYAYYASAVARVFEMPQLRKEGVVVYVVGAGRGPLVNVVYKHLRGLYGDAWTKRVEFYAVEKNPYAVQSLVYHNAHFWNQKIRIIKGDARFELGSGYPKADLIVSEMLGSFGDNELAPEIMIPINGAIGKDSTVFIPQSVNNFIMPITSIFAEDQIRQSFCLGQNRQQSVFTRYSVTEKKLTYHRPLNWFDHAFVCPFYRYYQVAPAELLFHFDLDRKIATSKDLYQSLTFYVPFKSDITGFLGYFDCTLADGINMDNVPNNAGTSTNRPESWFPIYFPLRKSVTVKDASSVEFHFARRVCSTGVWYEWQIDYVNSTGERRTSEAQNVNGESFFMSLPPVSVSEKSLLYCTK